MRGKKIVQLLRIEGFKISIKSWLLFHFINQVFASNNRLPTYRVEEPDLLNHNANDTNKQRGKGTS